MTPIPDVQAGPIEQPPDPLEEIARKVIENCNKALRGYLKCAELPEEEAKALAAKIADEWEKKNQEIEQ